MRSKEGLTAQEYMERFDHVKDQVLEAGETAIQMGRHSPAYFITSRGRVISVKNEKPHIMGKRQRSKASPKRGGNGDKEYVALSINGKRKNHYVHILIAEYFDVDEYFSENDTSCQNIHHKFAYDPEQPEISNRPENLLKMTKKLHDKMEATGRLNPEKRMAGIDEMLKLMPDEGISLVWYSTNTRTGETGCGIEKITSEELLQLFQRSFEIQRTATFTVEEWDYNESA